MILYPPISIIKLFNFIMLLKLSEKIFEMLCTSMLKFVVIKLMVLKAYRSSLVETSADNFVTIKNVTKLVGEIYIVGFFIGSNMRAILSKITSLVQDQIKDNRQVSEWNARVEAFDEKIQRFLKRVLPRQLPSTEEYNGY